MAKSKVVSFLFLVLLFVVAGSLQGESAASAQTDVLGPTAEYFLKITGIPGESKNDVHPGEIEVLSFGWGESMPMVLLGPAPVAMKAEMEDFQFTARLSKASPKLMEAVAKGAHLSEAVFSVRAVGEGAFDYLQIRLEDVMVTSYRVAGTEEKPVDTFSLSFGKITYTYWETKPDGSRGDQTEVVWDRRKNGPN